MRTICVFLMAVLLVCCDKAKREEASYEYTLMAPPAIAMSEEKESRFLDMKASADAPVQLVARKLIRNGNIHFTSKDVKRTRADMEALCKSLNAYISKEEQTDKHERLSFYQQLRVPADHFDELLLKTEQLAKHVDSRTVETEDVTEQFIDIESRLKTKKELEKRYSELLTKAHKVTELLTIETEMGNVRAEIESMEGKLNYLKNQVAFSTLDVTYYEEEKITDFGFGGRVGASLGTGWDSVLDFVIGIIAAWPVIVIGGVVVLFGVKIWRRRRDLKMS